MCTRHCLPTTHCDRSNIIVSCAVFLSLNHPIRVQQYGTKGWKQGDQALLVLGKTGSAALPGRHSYVTLPIALLKLGKAGRVLTVKLKQAPPQPCT
eukprot:1157444-Pelagomonas_calceolata.AAC.6